jgi:hypothetical protein
MSLFFFFWNPTGLYVKLRSHVGIFMPDLMQFQEPHRMCNNGGLCLQVGAISRNIRFIVDLISRTT